MPMVIAEQLRQWGHTIDLLEPAETVTCLSDLASQSYDAYVLKTVSDGPGLSILKVVEAVGIPTINNSRSISLVRDKTIALLSALPFPLIIKSRYSHRVIWSARYITLKFFRHLVGQWNQEPFILQELRMGMAGISNCG